MKSAFRSREEQLSNAARNYKKQSKRITQRHEKLLIHYRWLAPNYTFSFNWDIEYIRGKFVKKISVTSRRGGSSQ